MKKRMTILLVVACLVLAATSVLAAEETSSEAVPTTTENGRKQFCDSFGRVAGEIMAVRQSGTAREEILKKAERTPDPLIRKVTLGMIKDAYKVPVQETQAKKKEVVEGFASQAHTLCVDRVGKK